MPLKPAIAEAAFCENIEHSTDWLQSNLITLSSKLFSTKVITEEEQQEITKCTSNKDKTYNLLMVVQRRIKHDPDLDAFRNFVKAVESIPALRKLANSLVQSYVGKCLMYI